MWDFWGRTQGDPGSKKGLFLAQKLENKKITENTENLKKMATPKSKNHPAFHRRGFPNPELLTFINRTHASQDDLPTLPCEEGASPLSIYVMLAPAWYIFKDWEGLKAFLIFPDLLFPLSSSTLMNSSALSLNTVGLPVARGST